ncbi:MAG: M28 family peptidase [Planctomycetes bacterium]|nr:M28 family peptidase [Planctomycetota bacterium]
MAASCGGDSKDSGNEDGGQVEAAFEGVPDFGEDRAFEILRLQESYGPRNPGSEGHRLLEEFIAERTRASGAELVEQKFDYILHGARRPTSMRNLIARFVAPENKPRIVLGTHYDTRCWAENDSNPSRRDEPIIGADDGGSGTAVLLALMETLAKTKPDAAVDVIFFDGEDFGRFDARDESGGLIDFFAGSRYFAENVPPAMRRPAPAAAIVLDLVGSKDVRILREPVSDEIAGDVYDALYLRARTRGFENLVDSEMRYSVTDDHTALQTTLGWRAILLIKNNFSDFPYHTHSDTSELCSKDSLNAVGQTLVDYVYGFSPNPVRD